jgi:hypothetical protein
VLATQRIPGPVVIEIPAIDDAEPRGHVAVAAWTGKPAAMRIDVAGHAIPMRDGAEDE